MVPSRDSRAGVDLGMGEETAAAGGDSGASSNGSRKTAAMERNMTMVMASKGTVRGGSTGAGADVMSGVGFLGRQHAVLDRLFAGWVLGVGWGEVGGQWSERDEHSEWIFVDDPLLSKNRSGRLTGSAVRSGKVHTDRHAGSAVRSGKVHTDRHAGDVGGDGDVEGYGMGGTKLLGGLSIRLKREVRRVLGESNDQDEDADGASRPGKGRILGPGALHGDGAAYLRRSAVSIEANSSPTHIRGRSKTKMHELTPVHAGVTLPHGESARNNTGGRATDGIRRKGQREQKQEDSETGDGKDQAIRVDRVDLHAAALRGGTRVLNRLSSTIPTPRLQGALAIQEYGSDSDSDSDTDSDSVSVPRASRDGASPAEEQDGEKDGDIDGTELHETHGTAP